MIDFLLRQDVPYWDHLVNAYEVESKTLKVPSENSIPSLSEFNRALEELYSRAIFDFNRARTNHDAIKRFLKTVLEDAYQGTNDMSRKAAGIQHARRYPAPEYYHQQYVNLFNMETQFAYHFFMMEGVVKSIEAKMAAKVTNNSLLKLERGV